MAHIFTFDSPVCILGTKKRIDKKGRPFYTFYYKSDEETYNCVWFRCPVELKETANAVDENGKSLKGAFQWALDMKGTLVKTRKNGSIFYNIRVVSATIVDELKMPKPTQKEKWAKAIENYKPSINKEVEEKEEDLKPVDIEDFKPNEELVNVNDELPPLKEEII